MTRTPQISRRKFVASAASAAAATALGAALPATAGKPIQAMQSKGKGENMTTLTPYLLFDGTCREAMEFYHACLGGDLKLAKVKDTPAKDQMPAFQQEKVVNAHLTAGRLEISASDWLMPSQTPVRGNTVCLFLHTETVAELKTAFDKLSQGADVTNPLTKVFYGTYGALNDQFGVRWMFQTNEQAS
jgi:PhnB protein